MVPIKSNLSTAQRSKLKYIKYIFLLFSSKWKKVPTTSALKLLHLTTTQIFEITQLWWLSGRSGSFAIFKDSNPDWTQVRIPFWEIKRETA